MIEFKHQAYVVVGARASARDFICQHCEKFLGRSLAGYPDFFASDHTSYGIDEARDLRAKQLRASLSRRSPAEADGAKFFLVTADSLTHEAQNALLKTLEEPTANTFIFLAVPSIQNLLPTLLSRVQVVNVSQNISNVWFNEWLDLAEKFLVSKPAERFDMIEQIVGKDHPSRADARVFVVALTNKFRQKTNPNTWTKDQAFAAAELLKAEKYLGEPASLAKMILEHLALILPVEKV